MESKSHCITIQMRRNLQDCGWKKAPKKLRSPQNCAEGVSRGTAKRCYDKSDYKAGADVDSFCVGALMFYRKCPIIHLSPHQGTIRASVLLSSVLRGFFFAISGFPGQA